MSSNNDLNLLQPHSVVLPISSYQHKTVYAVVNSLTPAEVATQHQQNPRRQQQQHEIKRTLILKPGADSEILTQENVHNGAIDKNTNASFLCTPKKDALSGTVVQLNTPDGGSGERATSNELQIQTCGLHLDYFTNATSVNLIKNRYVIHALSSGAPSPPYFVNINNNSSNNSNNNINRSSNSSSSYSYRKYSLSRLRCLDIYTGEQFLCKIINEPVHKVQQAYFKLQQADETFCCSRLFGHQLIRPVKDIIPLNNERTYVIISLNNKEPKESKSKSNNLTQGVFENLHAYMRDKKCLNEIEARSLFYQICETVLICHRNGVILRDLKLKRFYFVDEARTMLQYESLEGSMILDNLNDDLLSDKIGCPLYTAPELLCPDRTYHGKPADIWSLGVMLYTMLIGQYPFYERGGYNILTVIRHHNVQMPTYLSRSVRRLLSDLLQKNFMQRITIPYIFLSPWLRDQGQFLMYVPLNSIVDGIEEEIEDSNIIEDAYTYNNSMQGTIMSRSDNEMS